MSSFPSQEHRPLKKARLGNVASEVYPQDGKQKEGPLKKARMGNFGPDVYPQDPKQKEDELNTLSVKHGFQNQPVIQDEYASARTFNITSHEQKIEKFFGAVVAEKNDLSTFRGQDQSKKKTIINTKDKFWVVIHKGPKTPHDFWFTDLAGEKPLSHLAKKVPIHKKEEIFQTLFDYNIPLSRATWYIQMTNTYNMAIAESKKMKRAINDPYMEWAMAVTKYLREQLQKVMDYYQGSQVQTPFLTSTPPADLEIIIKPWNYTTQLTRFMFEEGLLDRQEILLWYLELLEKVKITDDSVLKLILAQIMKYVSEYVAQQLLSRRLAYFCAKKLAHYCTDWGSNSTSRASSPLLGGSANGAVTSPAPDQPSSPLPTVFEEYMHCPQHRSLMLTLCSILQTITVQCPGSLVWHNLGEGKSNSMLYGSPLDLFPCPPSCLPMPYGNDNVRLRRQIHLAEQQIMLRGRAVEARWSSDKNQQSTTGLVISKVLQVLEILDRHNFDRVDSVLPLDMLYNKVFGVLQSTDSDETSVSDEPIITLLCEWAVSTRRTGEHRAVIVAKLLEKRQTELTAEKFNESEQGDDRESVSSDQGGLSGTPMYQTLLLHFLDTKAPVLEASGSSLLENKKAFANLILLFNELVAHDVFSHDAYMCTLISRGDLVTSQASQMPATVENLMDLSSIKSESIKQEVQDEMKAELENQNLDLESDIFGFKEEAKASPDPPGSVKSNMDQPMSAATPGATPTHSQAHTPGMARTPGAPHTPGAARTPGAPHTPGTAQTPGAAHTPGAALTPGTAHTPGMAHTPGIPHTPGMAHTPGIPHTPGSVPPPPVHTETGPKGPSRHLIYASHFPIPQDDTTNHECNQRMIILYGVGKARDEARHTIKRINKEILKLFSKRNCLDVSSGDISKTKRKKEKEGKEKEVDIAASFESTFAKFQKLTYYDQHAVTYSCTTAVLEVVSSFANLNSIYLPLLDNVAYLLDLMEFSLNIGGLLKFAVQLLKELPEVELQLHMNNSLLSGSYTTTLCLHIVGILRKYHAYMMVSLDMTVSAFDSLIKVVKHISNPADCSSSERCILAYLHDLYASCAPLKTKFSEIFSGPFAKVKNTIYREVSPLVSNLVWKPEFLLDLLDNPKLKPDANMIKQLNDSPQNRYCFVCNAVLSICNCQNLDRLNEISILCAELTASCNALSAEWLGVLKALCCSSHHENYNCGFIDILTQVDVSDLSIHDSLAVFTAILISRHCFTLDSLVKHVALHSLVAASSLYSAGDQDAEPGARLTCHLLLRLFQTVHVLPGSTLDSNKNALYIKSTCDRHLLSAAHSSIPVGGVLAILKAMLVLGDNSHSDNKSNSSPKRDADNLFSNMLSSLDDNFDMSLGVVGGSGKGAGGMESAGLSDYAQHALREICKQEWVREKFLKDPKDLFTDGNLLDNMLSSKHARQLVQLICHPDAPILGQDDEEEDDDQDQNIEDVLQNMDQWSLRVSWLELQLMLEQAQASGSTSTQTGLHERIAMATINVFQQQANRKFSISYGHGGSPSAAWLETEKDSIWLVAPLIAKLPSAVQGRVLKAAGEVLETGNNFWTAKNAKERERDLQKSTLLLANQPFLSLVLTCLRDQDEQRECLLKSLHEQLEKFVDNAKDQERGLFTDEKLKFMMQEPLRLRLSLVGGMFDTIQRNSSLTQDWAVLLIQLVGNEVVDLNNNVELFTVVLDMMSVLIHGTLVSENSEKGEENRKAYSSLVKKLKRELGERFSPSIDILRQLLPLAKVQCEVIVCEPQSDKSRDKSGDQQERRHGFQITSKQKINPWDLMEGHKNQGPLSLATFGAVRLERKPLKYADQHRLLLYHTHTIKKDASYFLEPPPLPPEDLEPPPEKQVEKVKEQDVEITGGKQEKRNRQSKRGRRQQNPARLTPTGTSTYMQPQTHMGGMGFPRPEVPPYNQTNWNSSYGQPPQGNVFTQQPIPPGGPRFNPNLTKYTLNSFIRARTAPGSGFMQNQPGSNNFDNSGMRMVRHPQHMALRARLLNPGYNRSMSNEAPMYPGSSMGPTPGPSFGNMPNQGGMNQGYPAGGAGYQNMGGAPSSGMMESAPPGVMSSQPGFNPQYQGGGAQGQSIGMMTQQPTGSYMGQQQIQSQNQFTPSTRFSSMGAMTGAGSSSTMQSGAMAMGGMSSGSMSGGSLQGYNQMGPQGGPQAPPGGYMQNMPNPQQQRLMQQQQQQRLMAMQQQQQQHGMQPQAQGPALYNQLQRQMSGGQNPSGQYGNQYQY